MCICVKKATTFLKKATFLVTLNCFTFSFKKERNHYLAFHRNKLFLIKFTIIRGTNCNREQVVFTSVLYREILIFLIKTSVSKFIAKKSVLMKHDSSSLALFKEEIKRNLETEYEKQKEATKIMDTYHELLWVGPRELGKTFNGDDFIATKLPSINHIRSFLSAL